MNRSPTRLTSSHGHHSSGGGGSGSTGVSGDGNPNSDQKIELPSRVAQWYYRHGLFLSSYPTCATSIAIVVVLLSCYPLLNIPLPGTIPTKVILPYSSTNDGIMGLFSSSDDSMTTLTSPISSKPSLPVISSNKQQHPGVNDDNNDESMTHHNNIDQSTRNLFNFTYEPPPFPWARIDPFIYVQQIVLRTQVMPWQRNLQLTDAFRGPLHEIFKLLEIVRNHESEISKTTLAHICLHVENVKRTQVAAMFPEYNCLVLSPANFWEQSEFLFNKDTNLLNTIYQHHNLHKSKVSTAEMLLGISFRDTGIKRYPIRARSRIIQYAITLVLHKNDYQFIQTLKQKLFKQYPLHQNDVVDDNEKILKKSPSSSSTSQQSQPHQIDHNQQSIMYIYYPGEFNILEFMPLCVAFIMLFIYVYFSVRKIDVIKSRVILALSAVITVLSSLMMSLGLCFFFGLTISMQSKGVFQYLVILVGLENVLVLTKSVVTTDHTFDVKIRVAQGLSKEGWTISKTLLTEITILTIGLATFVPVIQEFCIFAIVGLISDFFLQMMLFSTVLALDIKRVEFGEMSRRMQSEQSGGGGGGNNNGRRIPFRNSTITSSLTINRSRSHPKLTALDSSNENLLIGSKIGNGKLSGVGGVSGGGGGGGSSGVGSSSGGVGSRGTNGTEQKIPKRLRIVNFWARTRFFQRAFMIWMIVWICSIIYNSRILEQLFVFNGTNTNGVNERYSHQDEVIFNSKQFTTLNDTEHFILSRSSSSSPLSTVMPTSIPSSSSASIINDENTVPVKTTTSTNKNNNNNNNIPSKSKQQSKLLDQFETYEKSQQFNQTEQINRLKHPEYDSHYYLSNFHWSTILRQYNISISGRYVTVLPAIKLSHIITPDTAINIRNIDEKMPQHFQWKALAAALDPIDFTDLDSTVIDLQQQLNHHHHNPNEPHNQHNLFQPPGSTPLYPKSPMEIMLAAILCGISVFVLTYTMVVFYRCICTRNYAEWRSSWMDSDVIHPKTQRILEGVPIQVKGHAHRIECMVTDGTIVASSCLEGQVKIWDTNNGEIISTIDRKKYFPNRKYSIPNDTIFSSSSLSSSMLYYSVNARNNMTASSSSTSISTTSPSPPLTSTIPTQITEPWNFSSFGNRFNRRNMFSIDYPTPMVQRIMPNMATAAMATTTTTIPPNPSFDGGCSSSNESVNNTNTNFNNKKSLEYSWSPIWCLDYLDNLIVIGCADGRLEFWEASTGNLKCIYESEAKHKHGITNLHLTGNRVVAARLSGRIDFLRLESYNQGKHIDWGFTSAYRRTHVRAGSTGSLLNQSFSGSSSINPKEELRCILEQQHQGHQQPVTCMDVVGGIVFTGSQDHTLKVFQLDICNLQFTLHGHCGPITCLFIDHYQPDTGGSGSQDGLLCVWELLTGACMYSIQAHDGAIVSLACAPSYVISVGADERLCVWERFQGHQLNTINITHIYTSLLMLTPSLLITGKPGSLIVWDVRSGEPTREVKLDCANQQLCPKLLLPAAGSVICDYGNELRIVRFPLVIDKRE